MRVVLDTNVIVSAMLSPHAPPAQVVRLALQGDLTPLHDDRILLEYSDVLRRPRFAFDEDDVQALIDGLEWGGETVFSKPIAVELPDPDDLLFLEVASAGRADALVTGNPRHFKPVRGTHTVAILSPREVIRRLGDPRL